MITLRLNNVVEVTPQMKAARAGTRRLRSSFGAQVKEDMLLRVVKLVYPSEARRSTLLNGRFRCGEIGGCRKGKGSFSSLTGRVRRGCSFAYCAEAILLYP